MDGRGKKGKETGKNDAKVKTGEVRSPAMIEM